MTEVIEETEAIEETEVIEVTEVIEEEATTQEEEDKVTAEEVVWAEEILIVIGEEEEEVIPDKRGNSRDKSIERSRGYVMITIFVI